VRCRVVDGVGWGSEGMDREVGWEGEGEWMDRGLRSACLDVDGLS